jgi:hypothetical protein
VVLYGCETWSPTLREEHRLRVFENRVLRIFGPKRDEVTGDGGNCIMMSFITVLAKYNYNDQVKEEMGRACSMNGGDEECI